MKFINTVPVLTLALCAVADPTIIQRDSPASLATIQSIVSSINGLTLTLDKAVNSFSGDQGPLIAASNAVLEKIKSGTATISGLTPLELMDAANIAQGVTDLNTTVLMVVTDLVAKKPAFVSSGAAATVLQSLQDQKAAANSLAAVITTKVPDTLKELSGTLSSGITNSLQVGIEAFTGAAGSAPASPPPASASPASPPEYGYGSSSAVASSSAASSAYSSVTATAIASSSASHAHPSYGYGPPSSSAVVSSSAYGYPPAPPSSAPASKPTSAYNAPAPPPKGTGKYGYGPPPASSAYGYNPAPPASSAYGYNPAPPTYSKTKAKAPPAQYTGAAAANKLNGGLALLAAAALAL